MNCCIASVEIGPDVAVVAVAGVVAVAATEFEEEASVLPAPEMAAGFAPPPILLAGNVGDELFPVVLVAAPVPCQAVPEGLELIAPKYLAWTKKWWRTWQGVSRCACFGTPQGPCHR